jgi:hypothetical protein
MASSGNKIEVKPKMAGMDEQNEFERHKIPGTASLAL